MTTIKARDSNSNDPREMFDKLPDATFKELKELGKEMSKIIAKYYDPHTCIVVHNGEITIKRDVLNTYV